MLLLIPYLFPSARLLETAAPGLHLPALQTLLARGNRVDCPGDGVEAALCQAYGVARQFDWPLAPITLEADGGTAGDAYWLRADPVHLRLMRDRLVLTDNAALAISQAEADALTATIAGHFGDSLRLLPLHPRRWYLKFPVPQHLLTTPLSIATGRAIDALLPQGDDARLHRSLLNELQMLLHAHPVNLARETRGELPLNALWIWGGGTRPAVGSLRWPLFARDETARALGAYCGASVQPLPERLDESLWKTPAVLLLDQLTPAGQCGDAHGWRESMRALEENWFSPLLAALRKAGQQDVQMVDPVSGKSLQLRRSDVWKIWRRSRPLTSMLD
jgi:hypothetical protein